MKKTCLMLAACLIGMGHVEASDVLTVADVTLPQNSEATIEIGCEFETKFLGYSLDIELGGGLSLVLDEDNKPVGENGFTGTDHSITSSQPAEGKFRFVVVSFGGKLLPMSGSLLKVKVTGADSKTIGEKVTGKITATEFTDVNKSVHNLADVTFTITVGEPADTHTVLDETSTTVPAAATGVDVRVKRTIKANEWSTICLPFDMTVAQVTEAFGNGVELADFSSWSSEENEDGAIVAINVGFTTVTAIEANHPYLIKVAEGVTEFTLDGVDIEVEDEPTVQVGKKSSERGWMHGTYTATKVPEENVFLNGNKFYYSVGQSPIKAFRAYFEFKDVLDSYYDIAGARISFSIDGETTDISEIGNGELKIGNGVYDLQGRRVDRSMLKKGLYIKSGKKVIIK